MKDKFKSFIEGKFAVNFILGTIIYNAIALGLLTSSSVCNYAGEFLQWSCNICVVIFTIEMIIKVYVYGRKFFADGWNNFDFLLVAISWIPAGGAFSSFRAFRVLRALRALRLVTRLQRLRIIVQAIIEAIPNVAWASLLLLLIFYIFSIIGVTLYGESFPDWFGNIGKCMFTLFQVTTFEGWPDLARNVMKLYPSAWIYFIAFILTSSFIVINVIVGIIVNSISEINDKYKRREELKNIRNSTKLELEIHNLKEQLTRVEMLLNSKYNENDM